MYNVAEYEYEQNIVRGLISTGTCSQFSTEKQALKVAYNAGELMWHAVVYMQGFLVNAINFQNSQTYIHVTD